MGDDRYRFEELMQSHSLGGEYSFVGMSEQNTSVIKNGSLPVELWALNSGMGGWRQIHFYVRGFAALRHVSYMF